MMKFAFRTDASLDIGTGHVMRCLTLAEALRQEGASCHFICRAHPGNLISKILNLGFSVTPLAVDRPHRGVVAQATDRQPTHASWLGGFWRDDARATQAALESIHPDWLVVDHYALDGAWERAIRSSCKHLMVIDDLVDRSHDCDLLLDQTFGREADAYAGLVPETCVVLAGTRYVLLRREFATLRSASLRRRESGRLHRILVSMGGVDRLNATGRVLGALRYCPLPPDCRIVALMGGQAPWLAEVAALAEALPWPCEVKVDAGNIAELTADCDLAIGAAGGSAWERCALGVPSLLVVAAENQKGVASALERTGAARVLGGGDSIGATLPPILAALGDQDLIEMSRAAGKVCDGRGTSRMVAALHGWAIQVRRVREDDLDNLLRWRNHPDVRRWMYSSHEISPSEHHEWYARVARDPCRHLLIVEESGTPLGFVQFAETGKEGLADWGFYAVPGTPRGTGAKFGAAALDYAFTRLGIRKVRGETIASNESSIAFHRKLGFANEGVQQKRSPDGAACQDVLCFGLEAREWLERH